MEFRNRYLLHQAEQTKIPRGDGASPTKWMLSVIDHAHSRSMSAATCVKLASAASSQT
jgi:hypothetical protein